jgi:uncharacterized protein (DUF927 family)
MINISPTTNDLCTVSDDPVQDKPLQEAQEADNVIDSETEDTEAVIPDDDTEEGDDGDCDAAPRYVLRRNGVYRVEKGKEKWMCSWLSVEAWTRDSDSKSWGRILKVRNRENVEHTLSVTMNNIMNGKAELLGQLYSLGFEMSQAANVTGYILSQHPERKVRCVEKTGWFNDCYVLPSVTYAPGYLNQEEVVLQMKSTPPVYQQQGTPEDWHAHIGRYCDGNSRLMMVICAALAAPLLHLVKEESSGLHLYGQSSSGKTTALHVAASVWGCKVKTWRTTDNAAESLALGANDGLLCFDELSQVQGKVVADMIYMLGNGQRKARLNADITPRKTEEWRIVFISTGEITVSEKLKEEHKTCRTGLSVRMIELPADAQAGHFLFDTLHDKPNGNQLSQHLREASTRYTGTLGDAFLKALTNDLENAKAAIEETMQKWSTANIREDAHGQVKRVGRKFALLAAAGEYAIAQGLLSWETGSANAMMMRCFHDWCRERGGLESDEITRGIYQVLAFIEAHGQSRFEDPHADIRAAVYNRVGFREHQDGTDGEEWAYYATSSGFKEMCRGFNSKDIAAELVQHGLMEKSGSKNSITKKFGPYGKQRVYAFQPQHLERLRTYCAREE